MHERVQQEGVLSTEEDVHRLSDPLRFLLAHFEPEEVEYDLDAPKMIYTAPCPLCPLNAESSFALRPDEANCLDPICLGDRCSSGRHAAGDIVRFMLKRGADRMGTAESESRRHSEAHQRDLDAASERNQSEITAWLGRSWLGVVNGVFTEYAEIEQPFDDGDEAELGVHALEDHLPPFGLAGARFWSRAFSSSDVTRLIYFSAPAAWGSLIPFGRAEKPAFPLSVLPDWIRIFVEQVAAETETPPDLAAMAALTVLAAICQRRFKVEQRPGFAQPVVLWTMTMMSSGNRKSSVFDRVVAPLRQFEASKMQEMRPQIAASESALRRLKGRLAKAERVAVDAKDPEQRRLAIAESDALAQEVEAFQVVRAPTAFLTESTPERLEEVMKENGGRVALLAAEPGLLRTLGAAKAGDPNLTSLLDAYDGGDVRVGRMKREDGSGGDRIVRGAHVTIGISPQPEMAIPMLRSSPAFLDSGFAWRFQFIVPQSRLGFRTHSSPPPSIAVLEEYAACVHDLLSALPDWSEPESIPVVPLASDAAEALLTFEKSLEVELRPGGRLASVVAWSSKLTSRIARVAGLLHAADHRHEPWTTAVSLETMNRALGLAEYFIAHAIDVLVDLGSDPNKKRTKKAIEWIRREGRHQFSKRDLHREVSINSGKGSADTEVAQVIDLLVAHNYIRPAPKSVERGRGRPTSPLFDVNPSLFEAVN